jgi:hypothetical protein
MPPIKAKLIGRRRKDQRRRKRAEKAKAAVSNIVANTINTADVAATNVASTVADSMDAANTATNDPVEPTNINAQEWTVDEYLQAQDPATSCFEHKSKARRMSVAYIFEEVRRDQRTILLEK